MYLTNSQVSEKFRRFYLIRSRDFSRARIRCPSLYTTNKVVTTAAQKLNLK
jgi:hypothetical protein